MAWVRIEDGMVEHRKIAALSDRAFRIHIMGLSYCARRATDGLIPRDVARQYGWTRKTEELVQAGVWESVDDGWRIHDYLEFNPSSEEVEEKREQARARMARARSQNVRANTQRSSFNSDPHSDLRSPSEDSDSVSVIARDPAQMFTTDQRTVHEHLQRLAPECINGVDAPRTDYCEDLIRRGLTVEDVDYGVDASAPSAAERKGLKYLRRVLERRVEEREAGVEVDRGAGARGVRGTGTDGRAYRWRGNAGDGSARGSAPSRTVAGFDPTGFRVIGAE